MKEQLQLSVMKSDLSEEVWQTLNAIYPDGSSSDMFGGVNLPVEDERLQSALNYLAKQGFVPSTGFPPFLPRQFSMTFQRIYEPSDLTQCSYLTMTPKYSFGSETERDQNGTLHIPVRAHAFNQALGSDWQYSLIVSNQMKLLFEERGFQGMTFRQTVVDAVKNNRVVGELWEIEVTRILPQLSRTMAVVNDWGDPFDGKYDKGCLIREGTKVPQVLYLPPELHYEAAELQGAEPFDLALCFEQTGRRTRLFRQLVASQSLYQFCQVHQLNIDWQPVRVDG